MFDIQSILGSFSLIFLFFIFVIYIFRKENNYIALIILIAFSLRCIFSLLQEFYHIIPYIWDEKAFHDMSIGYFEFLFGVGQIPYDITRINSVSSYGTFLGTIYFFFGQHPLIARLVSCILGSSVIFLIYKLSLKLKLKTMHIYILCLIIAFTPSYIIFSGLIMRDMLIWILTYLLIYLFYKLFQKFNIKDLIYSILIIVPLILLRKQYAPLYGLYFFIMFLLLIREKKYYFISVNINFIKYIFFVFLFSFSMYGIYSLIMYELTTWDKTEVVEYFATQMSYRAQGGTAYLQNLEYNSYFDLIKYTPIKFIYFTYGPFIWGSSNLFILLAAVENLVLWFFSILFLSKVRYVKYIASRKNYIFFIFLFIFVFISLLANSIIDSNFGTAIRHRMVFVPIFYVLTFYLLSINKRELSSDNK